jgi:hypothetical protein
MPRPRTLHRAEEIGSALKGCANVCQRQIVNEVLGRLTTEFVRNFGCEGATPIQRKSNGSFFSRVKAAIKLIRHDALRLLRAATSARWSPIERTRFKLHLPLGLPLLKKLLRLAGERKIKACSHPNADSPTLNRFTACGDPRGRETSKGSKK